MKRMITANTTRQDIINLIVNGLKQSGCTFSRKYIIHSNKNSCELKFNLPNGKETQAIFRYNYNNVKLDKEGTHTTLSSWNSDWIVDDDGKVFDSSGQVVGLAIVRRKLHEKYKEKAEDYIPDSITTDSGDVVIEHPERSKDYLSLVQHLENRKVTEFS